MRFWQIRTETLPFKLSLMLGCDGFVFDPLRNIQMMIPDVVTWFSHHVYLLAKDTPEFKLQYAILLLLL